MNLHQQNQYESACLRLLVFSTKPRSDMNRITITTALFE
ncbi:hypothetical protein AvCA_27620 [Azotobacter vinelandii CA]|uniref:Uncharacterized protein n=2 Tax=Azotobacter vinelandii TaxID=354 RepID=C1DKT4_AZOVD|nr:hypothetical protein Avin_27620 [Azotobacter vinelandii DJ]AGK14856.1 hypothetical protein AvCA_27620 [Azotobacter vinelandii CA]AGK20860.1 hypothetical protein AvCA6_27620 [Azotobacter vinelandii CA6]